MADLVERLRGLGERALDLVFIKRCCGCGREGAYLCAVCMAQARPLDKPYFPDNAGGPGACLVSSVYLSGVIACFAMEGAVRQAVHALKYHGVRAIAPQMGEHLVTRARASGLTFDVVAPVPLHPRKQRERGYNQSALLAKHVAAGLGLPLTPVVHRTVYGPPQALSAGVQERRTAVQGAFQAAGPAAGLRVLLVDDVCTTGATLDACAQPLMFAGAASVWGLVFAREL
jgi:predicted amidophosphoribosyltransferase